MRPGRKRTSQRARKDAFVKAMGEFPYTITAAADAAGIGRTTIYEWRDEDPEFAKAMDEAYERGTDCLEREAHRRAEQGTVTRRHFDKDGNLVGEDIAHSDRLLELALKARRPSRYREQVAVEHSGSIAQPTAAALEEARSAGEDPELEAALEKVASLDAARARRAAKG
ncbi:MAG: terminase [Candidatus Rokuibacteriota bacterium]|nr:MAG: terminase [Candidatus Rokubacteria bacterium]